MPESAVVWTGDPRSFAADPQTRKTMVVATVACAWLALSCALGWWVFAVTDPLERVPRTLILGSVTGVLLFRVLSMRGGTLELSELGLSRVPEGGDAQSTPWTSVAGVRRTMFTKETHLLDAKGNEVASISDLVPGAEECLELVAEHAALVLPQLPVRWGLRGLPPQLAYAAVFLASSVLELLMGIVEPLSLAITGGLGVFWLLRSRDEVVSLAIDDTGLTLRHLTDTELVPWANVTGCGFRLGGWKRWHSIESYLEVDGAAQKLAPAGSPALVIVALVRRRMREAGTGAT